MRSGDTNNHRVYLEARVSIGTSEGDPGGGGSPTGNPFSKASREVSRSNLMGPSNNSFCSSPSAASESISAERHLSSQVQTLSMILCCWLSSWCQSSHLQTPLSFQRLLEARTLRSFALLGGLLCPLCLGSQVAWAPGTLVLRSTRHNFFRALWIAHPE